MRVSFNSFYQTNLNFLLNGQTQVNNTLNQLSSGKRVKQASDNPVAYTQILNFRNQIANSNQFMENASFADKRLTTEEGILSSVYDNMIRVRELMIQANNGVNGPKELSAIGSEMQELLDNMVALANHQDANGEYIFSGFQINSKPFTLNASGNYVYNGDNGHISMEIGNDVEVQTTDSGFDVFQNIKRGNGTFYIQDAAPLNTGTAVITESSMVDKSQWVPDTYTINFSEPGGVLSYEVLDSALNVVVAVTPYNDLQSIDFNGASISFDGTPDDGDSFEIVPSDGQSLFSSIQGVINNLQNQGSTPSTIAHADNKNFASFQDIDQAMDHILDRRTVIGGRINKVSSMLEANDDIKFQSETFLSRLEDLDLAEAATQLQKQSVALEASQAAFIRVQSLSIFNFL